MYDSVERKRKRMQRNQIFSLVAVSAFGLEGPGSLTLDRRSKTLKALKSLYFFVKFSFF